MPHGEVAQIGPHGPSKKAWNAILDRVPVLPLPEVTFNDVVGIFIRYRQIEFGWLSAAVGAPQ